MKSSKLVLAALALSVSMAAYSQADTTKKDTTTHPTDTTKKKDPPLSSIEDAAYSNQGSQANATQSNGPSQARNTSNNTAVINNASFAVETSQKSRPHSGKP